MSVLIKGLDMPKEEIVICITPDGEVQRYDRMFGHTFGEKFEAVPVQPHGRLIDADALQAKMYHEAFEADSDMQKWDSGCWIRYKLFENCIDSMPTIEPEQKKGEWIRGDQDKLLGRAFCSVCNEWEYQASNFNFCPNCGASMRKCFAERGKNEQI